eukprot:g68289.t1
MPKHRRFRLRGKTNKSVRTADGSPVESDREKAGEAVDAVDEAGLSQFLPNALQLRLQRLQLGFCFFPRLLLRL